jgi:transposase
VPYRRIKYLPTIRKIPDELWDEIKLLLPPEKSNKTIGRPVIPLRKVLDGILYIIKNRVSMEDAAKRIWFWLYYLP